jgi:quercetin dioxygenase-like cupin family protein
MLSRRLLGGCALCAGIQLIASGVRAQGSPTQGSPGFTRTVLNRQELPGTQYDCVQMIVAIDPGALVARHTHPGIESSVFMSGGGLLSVQGMPDRMLQAGEGFEVPPEAPHSLKNGPAPSRIAATFTVERGKALASPAPE